MVKTGTYHSLQPSQRCNNAVSACVYYASRLLINTTGHGHNGIQIMSDKALRSTENTATTVLSRVFYLYLWFSYRCYQ